MYNNHNLKAMSKTREKETTKEAVPPKNKYCFFTFKVVNYFYKAGYLISKITYCGVTKIDFY